MLFFILLFLLPVSIVHASSTDSHIKSIFQEVLYVQPTPVVQLKFPYSIDTNHVTTAITGLSTSGSGVVTQGTGMAFINPGSTTGSAAILASVDRLIYKSGQGVMAIFSAMFGTAVLTNTQYMGVGNARDGFFFGYNGTTFGILYRSSITGSTVDTWIPQTDWNGDKMNGTGSSGLTLVPELGNIFRIQYHWLGFGVVKFYIQNPNNGSLILVHTISFLNTRATPMITNASMQLLGVSINSATGASPVTLKTSCMMGAVQGQTSTALNSRFSFSRTNISPPGGISNMFTIQNGFTYPNGSTTNNQVMIYPDMLTLRNRDISRTITFYLYLNPTVGGTPAFTSISSNSVALSDTAGSTVSGGNLLYALVVAPSLNGFIINLSDLGIRLAPGDRIVVAFEKTGGNPNGDASLSWTEGF